MSVLEKVFHSPPGQALANTVGLPKPAELRRGSGWPAGQVVVAGLDGATLASATLTLLGRTTGEPVLDEPGEAPAPGYGTKIGAVVVDATTLRTIDSLEWLRAVLRPAVRALEPSGRVVLISRVAEAVDGLEAKAVAQAIDGINRTVGKELRGGATANLLQVEQGVTPAALASSLGFLLQGRSAFVDGQTWRVGAAEVPGLAVRPLDGLIVVVTGAARGIGAAIARVVAGQGAAVVAVDVPSAGQALSTVANEVGGTALQLDITTAAAGARIADHVASRHGKRARIHGVVHNAGITRDKLLVNTDADRWRAVLEVNLSAGLRINQVLLDPAVPGGLANAGRIVAVSSTSGLAGNKGQANYAASKAGVAGLVRALAPRLVDRGITVNAVAPGFIITEMTAKIPFLQREIFQRSSSLGQGGLPVDVAETIGYLLDPASAGVTGQVVRVCGQNLVGA